jgi:hypothetical protein
MQVITMALRQPKRIVIASQVVVVLLMMAAIVSGVDFLIGGVDRLEAPPSL